jgi:hypothetical protein
MSPKNIIKYSLDTQKSTDLKIGAELFAIENDVIYYYDSNEKTLNSCDLNGGNEKTLISNVKINQLYVKNGIVYYSSFEGTVGFYQYNVSKKTTAKISDKVADGMQSIDGTIYFLQTAVTYGRDDYPAHEKNGDAYFGDGSLYVYDGKTVTKK